MKKAAGKKPILQLVLDGTIQLVERRGGQVVRTEPIDGEIALKCIEHVLIQGLDAMERKYRRKS